MGYFRLILVVLMLTVPLSFVDGQTGKRKQPKPLAKATVPTVAVPLPERDTSEKKNERPAASHSDIQAPTAANGFSYSYEFTQPDFINSRIVIQHDDAGKGTISFKRKGYDEMFTDPLRVSPAALERIKAAIDALNFFESKENYQYEKDYSHLGNATFNFKRNDKQRTVTFNYTANREARNLADEYRKLANQFIWIFDITVTRENQPLDAPRLMDALDSMFKRNEVSDKEQMLPLLRELYNDERIPLIARNHATRLIGQIEKRKN